MLTVSCKGELPNPHKNCVREVLKSLICHENDIQRINIEIRNLQKEYKLELDKIECRCEELHRPDCEDSDKIIQFTTHIAVIDDVNNCFRNKIDKLKKQRLEILEMAKKCWNQLNYEKCKFNEFHDKTIDYLKRVAIQSDDTEVVKKCEKDVNEMQKLFQKEIVYIRKCENEMQAFIKQLREGECGVECECCCFRNYEWIPEGKNYKVVDEIACEIKNTMAATLKKAFAQLHLYQPTDPQSFLASYLMNIDRNERLMKEKVNLLGLAPKEITTMNEGESSIDTAAQGDRLLCDVKKHVQNVHKDHDDEEKYMGGFVQNRCIFNKFARYKDDETKEEKKANMPDCKQYRKCTGKKEP